jgi:hypothetical protein
MRLGLLALRFTSGLQRRFRFALRPAPFFARAAPRRGPRKLRSHWRTGAPGRLAPAPSNPDPPRAAVV